METDQNALKHFLPNPGVRPLSLKHICETLLMTILTQYYLMVIVKIGDGHLDGAGAASWQRGRGGH